LFYDTTDVSNFSVGCNIDSQPYRTSVEPQIPRSRHFRIYARYGTIGAHDLYSGKVGTEEQDHDPCYPRNPSTMSANIDLDIYLYIVV